MSYIKSFAGRAVFFVYGLFFWVCFTLRALASGKIFQKPSAETTQKLKDAQDSLWGMSKPNSYKHRFFTTSNRVKLHYVVSSTYTTSGDTPSIVIFIHGFPDSWALWRCYLDNENLRRRATLIAVDLPGYGGSDGLDQYDANSVLETMSSFIVGMRKRYAARMEHVESAKNEADNLIIVSHDWGAIIAYRLAAEAPWLANRYIMINSILPDLARANIHRYWLSAIRTLKVWTRQPLALSLLGSFAANMGPLLRQLILSGYIFVFNLPLTFPLLLASFGDHWLLRVVHEHAVGRKLHQNSNEAAEALASNLGPAIEQCRDSDYSDSVYMRAQRECVMEQIRYYREGLAFGRWRKSSTTEEDCQRLSKGPYYHDIQSECSPIHKRPIGALLAKTIVIWGAKDAALDARFAIAGIEDYLCQDSQVLVVPQSGHWLPLHHVGMNVLETSICWAISAERTSLKEKLSLAGLKVDITVEK